MWMGGCSISLPDHIKIRRFETVAQLAEMVESIDHDIVVVPAALADFAPLERAEGKISSESSVVMTLAPVPKVLPMIRKKCDHVIGFKAESGLKRAELEEKARGRLNMYGLDAIIANDLDAVGKTTSSASLVTADSAKDISGTKAQVSEAILNLCAKL